MRKTLSFALAIVLAVVGGGLFAAPGHATAKRIVLTQEALEPGYLGVVLNAQVWGIEGKYVHLQEKLGTSWTTVQRSDWTVDYDGETVAFEVEFSDAHSKTFRAVLSNGDAVSAPITVASPIPKPRLTLSAVAPYEGDTYTTFYIRAEGLEGKKASLQILEGNRWKTLASSDAFYAHFDAEAELDQQMTAAGRFSYRVAVLSGSSVVVASNTISLKSSIPQPKLTLSVASRKAWNAEVNFTVVGVGLFGQTPVLQRLVGNTWKNAGAADKISDRFSEASDVIAKLTAHGSNQFRAAVFSGSTLKYSSSTVKVTFDAPTKPKIRLTIPDKNTNVALLRVSDGRGLTLQLRQQFPKDVLLWKASKPATASSFTLRVPFKLTKTGQVQLMAIGTKPGQDASETASGIYQARAGSGPSKPFVNVYSSGLRYNGKKTLKVKGELPKGSVVSVQRLVGKSWKKSSRATMKSGAHSMKTSYAFAREGTAKVRVVVTKSGRTHAVSRTLTLKYLRKATTGEVDGIVGIAGFGLAEGRIAAGERRSDTAILFGTLGARKGQLQQYRSGKWKTVHTVSMKRDKYGQTTGRFTTPKESATVTVKYRIHVPATATERAWTSKSATVRHMNPKHYTGYIKASYDYMNAYCPNQVVIYGPKSIMGYPNMQSNAYFPSFRIEMSPNYSRGSAMRFVALHECAHIRTFKLSAKKYGMRNIDKIQGRLDKIYRTRSGQGMEHLADCMAKAMGGDIRNATYTRNCSGIRGTTAKRVLAGKMP